MSVQTCKLCLVGNGSVGKTSIVQRFLDDGFQRIYKQTVGVDFLEVSNSLETWRRGGVGVRIWVECYSSGTSRLLKYVLMHGFIALFVLLTRARE